MTTNDPVLDAVAWANPFPDDQPIDDGARERVRRRLHERIDVVPHKHRPQIALAVAAAVILVLAIAMTAVVTDDGPARPRELLLAAAQSVRDNPAWPEAEVPEDAVAVQQLWQQGVTQQSQFGPYSPTFITDVSVREGGVNRSVRAADPVFDDPAAQRLWEDAGKPALTEDLRDPLPTAPLEYPVGSTVIPARDLIDGQRTESAILPLLDRAGAGPVFRSATQLMLGPAVPREAIASLYRILAAQPDLSATLDGEVVTLRQGNSGVGLVFDRRDGSVLGAENLDPNTPRLEIRSAGLMSTCLPANSEPAPNEIDISCTQGRYGVVDLHWTEWGEDQASATGHVEMAACTPTCLGEVHRLPVRVTASRPQSVGLALRQYTRVDLAFDTLVPGLVNGGAGARSVGDHDWLIFTVPR